MVKRPPTDYDLEIPGRRVRAFVIEYFKYSGTHAYNLNERFVVPSEFGMLPPYAAIGSIRKECMRSRCEIAPLS